MTHFAKTHALFLAEGGAPWFTDTFCEGFGFAWGSLPFTKLTFFGPKVQDIFFCVIRIRLSNLQVILQLSMA